MLLRLALGTAVLAQWLSPSFATAQRELDVQDFSPALDSEGFIAIQGTAMPGHLRWNAGVTLGYARGLLRGPVALGGDAKLIVRHRLDGTAMFQMGLGPRLAVALELPFTVNQRGNDFWLNDGGGSVDGAAIGDLRLTARYRLIGDEPDPTAFWREGPALAPMLRVTFPTAVGAPFNGHRLPVIDAFVLADFHLNTLGAGANLGVRVRPDRERVAGGLHGSELHWGFAFKGRHPDLTALEFLFEYRGSTGFRGRYQRTNEFDIGARVFSGDVRVSLTTGIGFPRRAAGTPGVRVVVGLQYVAPHNDMDGDGVPDDEDECVRLPEDLDGFQDEDGCMDPDNDNDFVPDVDDMCPFEEALEGRDEDEDGCTDPPPRTRVSTPRPEPTEAAPNATETPEPGAAQPAETAEPASSPEPADQGSAQPPAGGAAAAP